MVLRFCTISRSSVWFYNLTKKETIDVRIGYSFSTIIYGHVEIYDSDSFNKVRLRVKAENFIVQDLYYFPFINFSFLIFLLNMS